MLLLLGEVGEQAGRAGEDRHRLDRRRREAEVEHHRGDRHRDVHRQRPAPGLARRPSRRHRASSTCGPLTPAGVGELEDPLGARVDRPVHRVAEPGQPARRRRGWRAAIVVRRPSAARRPAATSAWRLLEQPRARLRGAEDHRPAAEDPGRDGALQRARVGGQRHPRGDVRRHHPVLGDRDQQQVEEEALLLGRLVAGQQQVEVLGEAQPAHQVAAQVAPAHLDPVGVRLADVGDGGPRATDLHSRRRPPLSRRASLRSTLGTGRAAVKPGVCCRRRPPGRSVGCPPVYATTTLGFVSS